jgi:hypothetical protein
MTAEMRQNTLYLLEQLAGVAFIYQSTHAASEDASEYMYRHISKLVDLYTNAKDVEKIIKMRRAQQKALIGLFSSIGLMTGAGCTYHRCTKCI